MRKIKLRILFSFILLMSFTSQLVADQLVKNSGKSLRGNPAWSRQAEQARQSSTNPEQMFARETSPVSRELIRHILPSRTGSLQKATEIGKYQLTQETIEVFWFDPTAKQKVEYDYDGQHNNIRVFAQNWTGSAWENDLEQILTYDSNNMLTGGTNWVWVDNNWLEGTSFTVSYDSNGYPVAETYTSKHPTTGVVSNYFRTIYTNDTAGNLTEDIFQFWNGTGWDDTWRTVYSYDSNNQLIEQLSSTMETSGWENGERLFVSYDTTNQTIEEHSQYWTGSIWLDFFKSIISYNSDNNEVDGLGYIWTGSAWETRNRYSYLYDEHQNNIEFLVEASDDNGSTWYSVIHEWRTFGFIVTSIEENTAAIPTRLELHQNFPNPFNPSTTISFTLKEAGDVHLRVFDMNGSEISSLVSGYKPAGTYSVQLVAGSDLASGTYFYRLEAGGITQTKKFTLLK